MRSIITLIKNLFKAAKLLSVDDSGDLRFGLVSMLGKIQKVMIFSPYGLMHCPPDNCLAVVWSQQGQESNGIAMADDPAKRTIKNMAVGEVALGNYSTGNYIYFDKDGLCTLIVDDLSIQVSNDATIAGKNLTITMDQTVSITGADIQLTAPTLEHNTVNIGSTHKHSQGTDSAGDTEQDTGAPHS